MTAAELAVSAPVRVLERLRAAGDAQLRVLHRGAHAVYVALAPGPAEHDRAWCVGLVSASAVAVPCALRSAASSLESAPGLRGRTAHLRSGVLHIDGTALRVGRVVDARVPDLRGREACPAVLPEPAAELTPLLPPLGRPLDAAAAQRLVGRGSGLTPLGDDVLCGWLAAHRAYAVPTPDLDAAVSALSGRTTLLSASLLDCAVHGEVIPEFTAWLRAVGTPDEGAAAAALAALGHTSGAGLLHGGGSALRHLAVTGACAA